MAGLYHFRLQMGGGAVPMGQMIKLSSFHKENLQVSGKGAIDYSALTILHVHKIYAFSLFRNSIPASDPWMVQPNNKGTDRAILSTLSWE